MGFKSSFKKLMHFIKNGFMIVGNVWRHVDKCTFTILKINIYDAEQRDMSVKITFIETF